MNRRKFLCHALAGSAGAMLSCGPAWGASRSHRRPAERKFHLQQLASDGDNNAFFPSAAGGKILATSDGGTVLGYATPQGSVLWRKGEKGWARGALLPIQRPYLVQDQGGFLHVFGLRSVRSAQEVWHFTGSQPQVVGQFDEGEKVYEKNYSAAVLGNDGTIYYFGAGLDAFGFREKHVGGSWSLTRALASGPCIYPAAVCRGESIHLIFCGWNPGPALYEGVFYIRSDDRGATWRRSDGRALALPVDWKSGELEQLSGTQNTGGGEANTHNLSLLVDRAGRPHVLYWYSRPYGIAFGAASGAKAEPNVRVKHLRRDADGWKPSLLCTELDRDVSYATLAEDGHGRLHAIVTHKRSNDVFYDLGYTFSEDSGDTWSAIQPLTTDAAKRRLSYAHPAIVPAVRDGRLQFACNHWSGKSMSPVWYGEVIVA